MQNNECPCAKPNKAEEECNHQSGGACNVCIVVERLERENQAIFHSTRLKLVRELRETANQIPNETEDQYAAFEKMMKEADRIEEMTINCMVGKK